MTDFRKQVKEYIDSQPIKAVESFDFENNTIVYKKRRDDKNITSLPGDEEVVRAYLVTKLINELGYNLEDIEFEKEYSIGRPKKVGARIDIIVYKPKSNNIFMYIECKSPDKFKKEKDVAIENQLFSLAAQEVSSGGSKIDYLVYYSINDLDLTDNVVLIDFNNFQHYNDWKDSPDYYSQLLKGYNKSPRLGLKRAFGPNDVDGRIEGVISSINQHLKYTEVKDSILFINILILALFNKEFREKVQSGLYDSKTTIDIINEMNTLIVKTGGEIDNYSFTNRKNKNLVSGLVDSTCSSMKNKKELKEDQIYPLINCLKDISNNIFPIILYGEREDKILVSETIYKYIYMHKSGKNSIISTPANITNFMVKLLDLEEKDYFVEFCSGFGNFSLSYILYMENTFNSISGDQLSGVEDADYVYLFYITTLRIIGLNLIQADNGDMLNISDLKDLIPSYNSNNKVGAAMNPPFGGKDNKLAAQLVLKGCELLPKGSLFAVILPYVFAIGNASKDGFSAPQFHKDLLENNTLLGSFSLADGTFGATASTVVTTLLIETGIPHYQKNNNNKYLRDNEGRKLPRKKTYLIYCKDDGYKILKNVRIEKTKGLGEKMSNSWISDYRNKIINPIKSTYINLYEGDEWLIEAYMETDYSENNLTQKDFEQTIREYIAYKIENRKV